MRCEYLLSMVMYIIIRQAQVDYLINKNTLVLILKMKREFPRE